jgi:response regulator of citrate/malate metabolism
MNYTEAKNVLSKQEAAKSVLLKYEKLENAHEDYGFGSRRLLLKALQDIEAGSKRSSGRGARVSQETIDQILKLKAEGKNNTAISRATGISQVTVGKYIKANSSSNGNSKSTAATAKAVASKGKAVKGRKK